MIISHVSIIIKRIRVYLFIYLTFFKHGSLSTLEGRKSTIEQNVAFHRAIHTALFWWDNWTIFYIINRTIHGCLEI